MMHFAHLNAFMQVLIYWMLLKKLCIQVWTPSNTHPPEPTPHTFLDDIGVRATSVQFFKSHLCLSWLHSHGFLFD